MTSLSADDSSASPVDTVVELAGVADGVADEESYVTNPQGTSCIQKWCYVDCGAATMTKRSCRECCAGYWVFFPVGIMLAVFLVCVVAFVWSFFIDEDGDSDTARKVFVASLVVGLSAFVGILTYASAMTAYMICYALPKAAAQAQKKHKLDMLHS